MKMTQGEDKMGKIMKENKKISQMGLYKNAVPKTIYFMVCFLLIGLYLSCSEKYQEINSSQQRYQVKFYQGETLLKTISVISFTVIPASDYPANTNTNEITDRENIYEWYIDELFYQPYNENSLVIGNLNLYAKEVKSFQNIIDAKIIPSDLTDYDNMSKEIFSRYTAGAVVIPRYITANSNGNGSSWSNASGDIQAVVDGIVDASENKIYMVMVASGTYEPANSYVMKNHVALVGGFTSGSYDRAGETRLDGNNDKRLFYNSDNGLDNTALLYGMAIVNGHNSESGGGMFNSNSSPTLINITFSDNKAGLFGGGMYNHYSTLTLINVTFSGNEANKGGGMMNWSSSPTLNNVTFSENKGGEEGGGVYNYNYIGSTPPTFINVTFSGNNATYGGGMYNNSSRFILVNVTFSGNKANKGGGIFSLDTPSTLINTILWGNNNGNVFVWNDTSAAETVNLYHSLIEGGITPSTTATGIRLYSDDTNANPININSEEVIENNPLLGPLADNGGTIDTISIGSSSPAKNKGVYVREGANFYYSANNTDWYSDPGLKTPDSPPNDADDLTATDARGYNRVGRPDMGVYEELGTQ